MLGDPYGGYGGYGAGGGNEMMIVILCCICCLSIACLAGGYFTNIFCKVSTSLGRSCPPPETPSPPPYSPDPSETQKPGYSGGGDGSVNACSEAWGKTARAKNDPRPPIRPEYCANETRTIGRDCYFWKVDSDPVTGQARWMRIPDPDDPKADLRTGGVCTPVVQCANLIDPKTLDRYSELEPGQLLKQCTAVASTATNETDTIREITKEARNVTTYWTGTRAWNNTHSKIWYDRLLPFIGQRDMKVYIANSGRAAKALMNKLKSSTMRKSTFAYILEAAVRSPENRADWILDVTNRFVNKTLLARDRNEAAFIAHLRTFVPRPGMVIWERVIDNPANY